MLPNYSVWPTDHICAGSSFKNSATYAFQNAARRWVKWPWVSSLAGISTFLALAMRLISRSVEVSCGGLASSSPGIDGHQPRLDFAKVRRRVVVHHGLDAPHLYDSRQPAPDGLTS